MGWIAWIVLGGFAGWFASILTKNNATMGLFSNIIIGIIGALAGSWLMGLLGVTKPLAFNLDTFLVAVGGASILLFLFNMLRGNSRR